VGGCRRGFAKARILLGDGTRGGVLVRWFVGRSRRGCGFGTPLLALPCRFGRLAGFVLTGTPGVTRMPKSFFLSGVRATTPLPPLHCSLLARFRRRLGAGRWPWGPRAAGRLIIQFALASRVIVQSVLAAAPCDAGGGSFIRSRSGQRRRRDVMVTPASHTPSASRVV
jgi:hypothetical protein